MIQFRFGLTPLKEIQPWGGDTPALSWFSLTDGWYDIKAGGHHLLRHRDGTHVDYYVVRLWEDVLDALPEVLEPVPDDLVPFLAGDPSTWLPTDSPETEAAAGWHGQHSLDMGYLQSAPHIRWWRTVSESGGDLMTVTWTHAQDTDTDDGNATLPTPTFIAAVTTLHHDLLAAMEARVTTLETTGPPPGVVIDLPHLRHEQQDRATWLRRALDRTCDTDWAAVRAGARALVPPP